MQNNLFVPIKIRSIVSAYKTEYEDEEKLNFELPITDNMNSIRIADLPVSVTYLYANQSNLLIYKHLSFPG